jgi:hypothetical protein
MQQDDGAPIWSVGTVGRAADSAGGEGSGSAQVGFHAPTEGVLLQGGSGDAFVDLVQLADREPRAQQALGVGAVGIPCP